MTLSGKNNSMLVSCEMAFNNRLYQRTLPWINSRFTINTLPLSIWKSDTKHMPGSCIWVPVSILGLAVYYFGRYYHKRLGEIVAKATDTCTWELVFPLGLVYYYHGSHHYLILDEYCVPYHTSFYFRHVPSKKYLIRV